MIARLRRHLRAAQRGQSLLEMTMILPVFLLLVLGTLEFGMAFDHNLTLEYASREGVRTGSALANGGGRSAAAPARARTPGRWTTRSSPLSSAF